MNVAQLKRFCRGFPNANETHYGEPYNFLVYSVGGKKFAYFKTSDPERWRFSTRVHAGSFHRADRHTGREAREVPRTLWLDHDRRRIDVPCCLSQGASTIVV